MHIAFSWYRRGYQNPTFSLAFLETDPNEFGHTKAQVMQVAFIFYVEGLSKISQKDPDEVYSPFGFVFCKVHTRLS